MLPLTVHRPTGSPPSPIVARTFRPPETSVSENVSLLVINPFTVPSRHGHFSVHFLDTHRASPRKVMGCPDRFRFGGRAENATRQKQHRQAGPNSVFTFHDGRFRFKVLIDHDRGKGHVMAFLVSTSFDHSMAVSVPASPKYPRPLESPLFAANRYLLMRPLNTFES